MRYVTDVSYISDYKLLVTFQNGISREVDLEPYLDGEVFQPLRDVEYFKCVKVDPDIDTIAWENGADFAPEFLYEIGISATSSAA